MSTVNPKRNHLLTQRNRWVTARKITQALSLLGFTTAIIATGLNRAPYDLSSVPVRLSPLAMLAALLSSRIFLTGMTISLILLLASLVFGRAWCGWLCPLGTVLDIFKFRSGKSKIRISEQWRGVKYGLLIVILISAVFSNLTLLIFDPLTIYTRTVTVTILPAMEKIVTTAERLLASIPFMTNAVYRFDLLIRPALFPLQPIVFQYAVLTGVFFSMIVLLNLLAERFWCRYLCPLGALLGFISKAAVFKRRVSDNCGGCHLCELNCPTDTIDPAHDFKSDPAECIMYMNCLQSCQKGSLSFAPRFDLAPRYSYDAGRRTFMNSLLASVIITTVLSLDWFKQSSKDFFLRPPGVTASDFSTRCIRCGLCLKVCPTGGLQIDMDRSGVESAGIPLLVPRMGFCQFSCNACGQICPVQAIPPLSLEEKQSAVIGKAYIDHDRCIAWGDHQTCIVCEEMCPLPQKAITLESGTFPAGDGTMTIPLPVVNRDTCIGCGICENKCPVAGESAIRVHIS